jgi:hypothetical protein
VRVLAFGMAVGLTMTVGLLAACAGNNGGGVATAGASPTGGQAVFQAYADCLRQHGVTITVPSFRGRPSDRPSGRPSGVRPSGRGGGGGFGGGFGGFFGTEPPPGVDQGTWDSARQACAGLRPSFGPARGNNSAFQAYRNCLQEHGVDFSAGPGGGLNTADPKVAAAMTACAPLRPSGRPSAGS